MSATYRCGYTTKAPWPYLEYKPNHVISPRHVVPGDNYPDVLGSTKDWTEVMDCELWEKRYE